MRVVNEMDGKAVYFVGAGLPKALQRDGFHVPSCGTL
jgi:hypothetical protein